MQIIIEDNRTLRLAQVFESQSELIFNRFRIKDPQAFRKRAMRTGHWDGYINFYSENKQVLEKGFLKDLIELCLENDIPFDIVDQRDKSKYPLPAIGSFDAKLIDATNKIGQQIVAHKHQMRCWNSVCMAVKHPMFEIATHFHPTGGGKSLMMAGIVKLFRCPTVVITNQTIVLSQLAESLKLFNVVHHDDVGEFYSGKMPEGNLVCVGSIAALATPKKPVRGKFKVKFQTLQKDFNRMVEKEKDKLKDIVTQKGILVWIRSNVIDNIQSRWQKNPKEVELLVPSDLEEWGDDTDNEVNDALANMLRNHSTELLDILGATDYTIVKESKIVENSYEEELTKALHRFDEYERDKYFKAAMKAYKTLVVKTQQLQEMVGNCELLLVDEMDNASAANYDSLFEKWFKGRYIHGFSGTPYDPDKPVEKMKLQGRFGPIISRSTRKELEEIGQIQPIKYYSFQFGDIAPRDKTAFDIAERVIIIDNDEFHQVVATMIANWPNEKHLIIIDTCNIEDVGKALEAKIPGSAFLFGKTPIKKRNQMIDAYERGELPVLIVSKIGKRGMDLGGGCDNMFLIGGGKGVSNFDQIIGRGVRLNERRWARVIDFYFTGSYYLLDHSRKRLRCVDEMGYVAKVVMGKDMIDVDKFIKSRYKIPPALIAKKAK